MLVEGFLNLAWIEAFVRESHETGEIDTAVNPC